MLYSIGKLTAAAALIGYGGSYLASGISQSHYGHHGEQEIPHWVFDRTECGLGIGLIALGIFIYRLKREPAPPKIQVDEQVEPEGDTGAEQNLLPWMWIGFGLAISVAICFWLEYAFN